jgi:hypothetical protein
MKVLVDKYPGGYEAWAEEHGELPEQLISNSESSIVLDMD